MPNRHASDAAHELLRSRLVSGEVERGFGSGEAREGDWIMVTDSRVLWGVPSRPERVGTLDLEAITSYQQIVHGHRGGIRLQHTPIVQLVRQPAHRMLWWEWGNAEGVESFSVSTFRFSGTDTAVGMALLERLAQAGAREDPPIRIETPRREEAPVFLVPTRVRYQRLYPLTRWVRHMKERLYVISLYWRVRLPGWALFSLPFALVSPWLVPLGVLFFEGMVIGIGQWMWHRDAWRRKPSLPRH
jgi:hypothetical protein